MKKTLITLLLASSGTVLWAQQTQSTTGQPTGTKADSSTIGTGTNTQGTLDNAGNTMDDPARINDQGTTTDGMNNPGRRTDSFSRSSAGSYNAYGAAVPFNVQRSFAQEVPSVSDAQWEPSNEYWKVRYNQDGKEVSRYYGANGQGFTVALPIMASYVPQEVMDKVKQLYGDKVYDVTMLQSGPAPQSETLMSSGSNAAMSSDSSAVSGDGYAADANSMNANSGITSTSEVEDPEANAYYHVRVIENGTVRSEWINADGSAYVAPTPTESLSTDQQSDFNTNQQMNNNAQQWNNNQQTETTTDSTRVQQDGTDMQQNWNNNTDMNTDSTQTVIDSTNAVNGNINTDDRLQTENSTTEDPTNLNSSDINNSSDLQSTDSNTPDPTGVSNTTDADNTTSLNSVNNSNAYGNSTDSSGKKSDKKMKKNKHVQQ